MPKAIKSMGTYFVNIDEKFQIDPEGILVEHYHIPEEEVVVDTNGIYYHFLVAQKWAWKK